MYNTEQVADVPTKDKGALIMITQLGDTISTGIPFEREGKIVPLSKMIPPLTIQAKPIVDFISKPPKEYTFSLKKAYPFPKPDTLFFGKNGIAKPLRRKAKVSITNAKYPKATTASPFFYKGLEDGDFGYLTLQQGLPSNIIYDIIKDKKGFFWIASKSGLSRYDGKTFRHYTPEHGLPTETISGLCLDSFENIWMATNKYSGLIKFDGKKFYQYNVAEGLSYSKTGKMNIHFDQDGKLTFSPFNATNGKLVRFDGTHFIEYGPEQGFHYDLWPQWLHFDDDYYYWTLKSLIQVHGDYILQYDINKLLNASIQRFSFGLKGEPWVGLEDQICTIKDQQIFCYHSKILQEDKIRTIGYDKNGHLMLKHKSDAVSLLKNNVLTYHKKENLNDSNIQFLSGWIEFNNILWKYHHHSQMGIQQFDPNNFHLNPNLQVISSMMQDSKNQLWFGTHGKGFKIKSNFTSTTYPDISEKITNYLNLPKNTSDVVRSIYEDSKGNIWISAIQGVLKFDGNQFTYYNLQLNPNEKINAINAITEDSNGNLWFATSNIGFIKFDSNQFTFYTDKKTYNTSFNSNNAKTMITDRKGMIWIGLQGGGLVKYDPRSANIKGKDIFKYYTEQQGLCSNYIVSLFEDSKGNIWIGSDRGGISRFDGETFTNYTKKDGLSNNDIWSITEDNKQNIWLAADDCLNLLFFEKDEKTLASVTAYCVFSGQSGIEFFSNSSLKDKENNLYWGLNGNSIQINSSSIFPNAKAPEIHLDEIEINQQHIDFNEVWNAKQNKEAFLFGKNKQYDLSEVDFQETVPFNNYPQNLRLTHHLNSIGFRFSATNSPDLTNIKFSYILEGSDLDWSEPGNENYVYYRNLPPDTYTFKVKAIGKNSIRSTPFKYTFTITPPWWKTPFAYFIYFSITGGLVYLIYQFNLKRRLEQTETRRVKELNNLKTRLYTNITHEFRTPLTVIMGMNENTKGNLQQKILIRRNSKNLLRLVNQLLDLSKLESGTMKTDQIQGDIVVYLQYLTESFYSMAEEKGIRLMFYSEEDFLLMDYDEIKIQHIIYNLISNALKFTPNGGKVILHLAKFSEGGQLFIKLKVKDTGIGIPENKILHIFDRFYQVDGTHTRNGEGTGIGLTLTKELIHMLDGEIQVKSIVDKGTEFTISLPISNKSQVQGESKIDELYFEEFEKGLVPIQSNDDQLDIPIADQKEGMPEVLIIEDNKDVATYIETLLRSNYKIHLAINGQLGIDAAIEIIPDIIISDVMMPEKDGFEVCKTLKQDARTSHIPIILLTAKSTQTDKVEGLKHGADAFLIKPFDKTELFIRIEKLISIRRQLQQHYSELMYLNKSILKSANNVAPIETIENKFITEIKSIIEKNYTNSEFGVNELSKSIFMSHTQVYRKIKALTGKTPSQFIRSTRLQKGYKLLQESDLNISEIAYDVGFSDPNYFSRTFQKEFGKPPSDIRK